MNTAHTPKHHCLIPSVGIVLLVCAAVYLPRLGVGGLTMTEGHRAIPAWEMLETGEWLVPHLFGQPYLRKPPGMVWAIALSSSVLGVSEFAARLVSALAASGMAVVALVWSRRWFGARAGLAAGLAQALMPQMWAWGRSAEIETLNALGAQLLVFGVLETVRTKRWRASAAVLIGLVVAAAAKGPAALPCLLGAIGSACIVLGPRAALKNIRLWSALFAGIAVVAIVMVAIGHRMEALGQQPVTQSVAAFMWQADRIGGVLAFPLAAWVSALPISLALLFPWGPGARAEANRLGRTGWVCVRLAAWTWVLSISIYMLAGVSNPRYALPAAAVMAPVVGYVFAGMGEWMDDRRARIARTLSLGMPPGWVPVLLVGAGVFVFVFESRTRDTSGRMAGLAMGERIVERLGEAAQAEPNEPIVMVADHVIEARPETLWYAARRAQASGVPLVVLWTPGQNSDSPAKGDLVAIRDDAQSPESGIEMSGWELLGRWDVHKYQFKVLLRRRLDVP